MSSIVWRVKELAYKILEYLEYETDCCVGIAGEEGIGKSVLARLFSYYQYPKLLGKPIDLWECLYYGRMKLHDDMKATTRRLFIHDEAIANMNRTFTDKKQIQFAKLMRMVRDQEHILYQNIPVLWELDKTLRNRVRVYVYIYQRVDIKNKRPGRARIFKKENLAFGTDPWNVKINEKLERAHKINRSPNYYGDLIIPYIEEDWFKTLEAEAKKIKTIKKEEAIKEDDAELEKIRASTVGQILVACQQVDALKYGTIFEICKFLRVDYAAVRRSMSEVRREIELKYAEGEIISHSSAGSPGAGV